MIRSLYTPLHSTLKPLQCFNIIYAFHVDIKYCPKEFCKMRNVVHLRQELSFTLPDSAEVIGPPPLFLTRCRLCKVTIATQRVMGNSFSVQRVNDGFPEH